MVHVEGHLKMDTWDDRTTGEKRSKIKVEAEWVQFLDGGTRREDSAGGPVESAMDEDSSRPLDSAPPRGRASGPPNGAG